MQIVCSCPKGYVLSTVRETLEKYGELKAEIWQGLSVASIEEYRKARW